jgi:NADPH-dependent glutamate synthase beta subunit-like oxidoreductase
MDIPNYIMAIAQGSIKEALATIRESNPLPSVCGRACHHPCELECNRSVIDSPIAIQWLKRYAADWGNGDKPNRAPRKREERVAIVGAGPAGLTAAHDLVKKGYGATVFEASLVAGGMLSSVIPDFILSQQAVQSDIDYIKSLGVHIHTGVRIGKDLGLDDLWQQGYKAILIATGTPRSAMLRIPGAELPGIIGALPFLNEAKNGHSPTSRGKLWVIGGGGVALDVSRVAARLGFDEVHLACLESRKDMPAFKWEIELAEKEGVHVHPSLSAQQYITRDGSLGGIIFKRVTSTSADSEGRIRWTLMAGPGSDYAVDADFVVVGIGQGPDIAELLAEPNHGKSGGLSINRRSLQTNVPGVFTAGDVSATGGTISDAMAAGRRAATYINQYLNGLPIAEVKESREILTIKPEQVPGHFVRKQRWEMPRLLPKEAIRAFKEVDLGYKDWQAVEEARRCLNCRMCANCIFERGQLCFETASRLYNFGR